MTRNRLGVLGLMALIGCTGWLSAGAIAGDWLQDDSTSTSFPCQDGWATCRIGGVSVAPGLAVDSNGQPVPAGMRVSWSDLKPTAVFSGFVNPQDSPKDKPVVVVLVENDPTHPERESFETPDTPENTEHTTSENLSEGTETDIDPEQEQNTEHTLAHTPPIDPEHVGTEHEIPEDPNQVTHVFRVVQADCAQLKSMEQMAMLGRLVQAEIDCLEDRLAKSPRITEKDAISRVLMANAFSAPDQDHGKLLKRHLVDIDRSDPDMAYKYARTLEKKGTSQAKGVIRWSEVALERRDQWPEAVFKTRVFGSHKMRAVASSRLWKAAEEAYVKDPSAENGARRDKYRNLTKVNAREWFDYARMAHMDTYSSLRLCQSAAGTENYCVD